VGIFFEGNSVREKKEKKGLLRESPCGAYVFYMEVISYNSGFVVREISQSK